MCIKSMPHFCNYFGTSCDRCVLSTCGPVAPVAMGKASGAGDVLKKKGGIMKKPSQGKAANSSPEYAAKSMPKKSSEQQKLLVSKARAPLYAILGFGARERRLDYVRFLRIGGRRLLRCECHCEYMCVIIFVKSPIIFHTVD